MLEEMLCIMVGHNIFRVRVDDGLTLTLSLRATIEYESWSEFDLLTPAW